MRLRWLVGNFADPQYELSREAQADISMLAHKRYMRGGRFALVSLVAIALPILLLMRFAVPPALEALGYANASMAHTIAIAVLALVSWPLSAYVYGHLYVSAVRRAMRDRGHNICLGCGYRLNELPADVVKCPECGRVREPVDAAEDGS